MKGLLDGLVLPRPEPDSEPEPEPAGLTALVVLPTPPPCPSPSASVVSASRQGPSSTAKHAPRRLGAGPFPGGRKQSRRVRTDSSVASDVRDSPPKKKTSHRKSLPKSSTGLSRSRTGSHQRVEVPSQSEDAPTPTDSTPRRKSGRVRRPKPRE